MAGPRVLKALKSGALRESDVQEASRALRAGAVVAFPTETVYGIGANPFDEQAARRVFRAKRRGEQNPLTCHVSGRDQAADVVAEISPEAELLMSRFWPGPLTLVLLAAGNLPGIIRAGGPGIGVRAPDHPATRQVLETAGIPIAGTSANVSGRPAAVRPEDVLAELGAAIDVLIDGGVCRLGVESTVLDLTARPAVIWRLGAVLPEEIAAVLEQGGLPLDLREAPAPLGGQLSRRPAFRVVVVRKGPEAEWRAKELAGSFVAAGLKVGLLLDRRTPDLNTAGAQVLVLGISPERRLYTALREAERLGLQVLMFVESDQAGMERIAQRLLKAGGEEV